MKLLLVYNGLFVGKKQSTGFLGEGDKKESNVGRGGKEGEDSRGTRVGGGKQKYREDDFRDTRLLRYSSGAWDRFRDSVCFGSSD